VARAQQQQPASQWEAWLSEACTSRITHAAPSWTSREWRVTAGAQTPGTRDQRAPLSEHAPSGSEPQGSGRGVCSFGAPDRSPTCCVTQPHRPGIVPWIETAPVPSSSVRVQSLDSPLASLPRALHLIPRRKPHPPVSASCGSRRCSWTGRRVPQSALGRP